MKLTHTLEGDLLYSEFNDLNVIFIKNNNKKHLHKTIQNNAWLNISAQWLSQVDIYSNDFVIVFYRENRKLMQSLARLIKIC